MNLRQFNRARRLLAEESVGALVREHQRSVFRADAAEDAAHEASKEHLRARQQAKLEE